MTRVLINGIPSDYVSALDRGLHYGDGVFETIACIDTNPVFMEQHLNRMEQGAARLNIPFPNRLSILDDIEQMLSGNSGRCVIKLILTRGQGRRGYRYSADQLPTRLCMLSEWPDYIRQWQQHGIKVRFCETPVTSSPRLNGIKSLNRLENVLASNELDSQTDEGFMSNADGHVIEGTMSNIFAVIDGCLVTPDLSQSGIKGIMREQIIGLASDNNIRVQIRTVDYDELMQSRAIFICNSIIGICPVERLEQRPFKLDKMTNTINELLQRRIEADAKAAA